MGLSAEDVVRTVLNRFGTTLATDAGLRLEDQPAALFQLLVLAELVSARIAAETAVATAAELRRAGWTTSARLRDAPRPQLIAALGRGGYRRYDLRTAGQLTALAELVLARYGGDLRRLAAEAAGDVDRAAVLLQEFPGIGPTGAAVFLREVQAVWPWVRPFLDGRARSGAERVGLPADDARLAALVPGKDLARLSAGLARVARLRKGEEALVDVVE
jgi:endonuclease III